MLSIKFCLIEGVREMEREFMGFEVFNKIVSFVNVRK